MTEDFAGVELYLPGKGKTCCFKVGYQHFMTGDSTRFDPGRALPPGNGKVCYHYPHFMTAGAVGFDPERAPVNGYPSR